MVAMVYKTACDGFRLGKVVESKRCLAGINRVTRRKEGLEGKEEVVVETKMSKWMMWLGGIVNGRDNNSLYLLSARVAEAVTY